MIIKNTSSKLFTLIAKRDAITKQIRDTGLKAIDDISVKIAGHSDTIKGLRTERDAINAILENI